MEMMDCPSERNVADSLSDGAPDVHRRPPVDTAPHARVRDLVRDLVKTAIGVRRVPGRWTGDGKGARMLAEQRRQYPLGCPRECRVAGDVVWKPGRRDERRPVRIRYGRGAA